MPRRGRDVNVKTTPNFDGKYEGVLNDDKGTEIGVQSQHNKQNNPFNVKKLNNDEMEDFKQVLKGTPVDQDEDL